MYIPAKMKPHINKIFCGEYNIAFEHPSPVIVDIGANIGGFTRWAYGRWANSKIYAFEPIKQNYEMLVHNTSDLQSVSVYNLAVSSFRGTHKMFYGRNNEGEASMWMGNQQSQDGEDVDVIPAQDLPQAHMVKIDTEGAEVEIISAMSYDPVVYLIEFHSEEKRLAIEKLLSDRYILAGCDVSDAGCGIVKYALKANIIQ